MHGENNGKPYEQMDDLGFSHIFGNTHMVSSQSISLFVNWLVIELVSQLVS